MAPGDFPRRKKNTEETSAIFVSLKAVEAFIVYYQKIKEKWILTANPRALNFISAYLLHVKIWVNHALHPKRSDS